MPEDYTSLVAALKALTQGEAPNTRTLPMCENEWDTRPDEDSWGTVALEFEADALHGDNLKQAEAYEGSVDLFSYKKDGDGWPALIRQTITVLLTHTGQRGLFLLLISVNFIPLNFSYCGKSQII